MLVLQAVLAVAEAPAGMALVPAGTYAAFYPVKGEQPLQVAAFWLDERPVTNAEFLAFVRAHERWQRSKVGGLFADDAYLSNWAGDLDLGPAGAAQPVTFVSWFAASAYCRSVGKRLPTEAEWELAASPADEDPQTRSETARRTLAFYARPRGELPRAGDTPPNRYGIRDLHGVIWEWVSDWNASLVLGDNRQDRDPANEAVCGGAAAGASDAANYATFMRFAFRSSLEGAYALHHLGFRCARSAQ
jgi:formylglycine-generating enzyme required for sulfatase activity